MKLRRNIFHLILSILFITISIYPCADKYVSDIAVNQTTSYQTVIQQDNHNIQSDFCSPLCICGCCSASLTIIAFTEIFSNITIHTENKEYSYLSPSLSGINHSIWQPPKIV
ncbi:DUF6660 family protein [Myroides indicus]|uniref:DUF6660 family protein n=1 Tax=Myroides indicus TaxID=1323422 RepID=UPI0010619425|nr:DUF6660 family protein [Myroides indicus]